MDELRVGDVVRHHQSGHWLKVEHLDDTESSVSGLRFVMASLYDPLREDSPYEAYMVIDVIGPSHDTTVNDPQDPQADHLMSAVPIAELHPVLRTALVLTNDPGYAITRISVERPKIFCRTRITRCYKDAAHKTANKPYSEVWQSVPAIACTAGRSVSEYDLRCTRYSEQLRTPAPRRRYSTYTGCDLFCGAGFASDGMRRAGIEVLLAVDDSSEVLASYQLNHPSVTARQADVMKWLDTYDATTKHIRFDILHISFPCQFFSAANTRQGMATNDDQNEAAWFSLDRILDKIRPRAVCIEQTVNIHNALRHRQHHEHCVRTFRARGYSIQWKKINFASLGLCTTRKRLIYIAAAQGDTLPPFPLETHDISPARTRPRAAGLPDLLPAVTVADVLRNINQRHVNHVVDTALPARTQGGTLLVGPPWDPRETLIGTLCCGQSNNAAVGGKHFSGKRRWTAHELMLINGSTPEYKLAEHLSFNQCHKQVGNAFPSLAAEKIYQAIVEHLRYTDRIDREETRRRRRQERS